jgi:hypothetical protein
MRRVVIAHVAASLVATGALIAWAQAESKPHVHFALAIRATSQEVSLLCEGGCSWKALQFPAARMPVVFDSRGLLSEQRDKTAGIDGFAISVRAAGDNLELKCQSGCRWMSVSLGARFVVTRVDENGLVRAASRGSSAIPGMTQGPPAAASAFPAKWNWSGVGSTMSLHVVEGERIDARNVAPVYEMRVREGRVPRFGGVESASLLRMGALYAGSYRSSELCFYTEGDSESQHECRFEKAIEITLLTPTKIEGRAESDFAFDCRSCRITRVPRMKPFVWTPAK